MDTPAGECTQTFLHHVLRWLAVLALGYGFFDAVTLIVFAVYDRLPYDRMWLPFTAAMGFLIARIALAVLLILGGAWLLRWKSHGRTLLMWWSAFTIVLGLISMIGMYFFYSRQYGATTQPSYGPSIGFVVWNSFHYWIKSCALPILFLSILMQSEVSKLWSQPRRSGFEVIPIATVAVDPANAALTEVDQ
jgi:hypothetical protein